MPFRLKYFFKKNSKINLKFLIKIHSDNQELGIPIPIPNFESRDSGFENFHPGIPVLIIKAGSRDHEIPGTN